MFEIGKSYRMVDGSVGTLKNYNHSTGTVFPLVGSFTDRSGSVIEASWRADGGFQYTGSSSLDLMPVEVDAPTVEEGHDPVSNPSHYTSHPSGIECIQVTEHMGFCLGNAVKYIWRADLKADAIEDLRKARWYIDRELEKRGAK